MNKFIATFGSGQINEGYYLTIVSDNYSQALEYMENEYMGKYCMIYTESDWNDWVIKANKYGLDVEKELNLITI